MPKSLESICNNCHARNPGKWNQCLKCGNESLKWQEYNEEIGHGDPKECGCPDCGDEVRRNQTTYEED